METFTCKEIMKGEGGCDEAFEAETAMDIAKQSATHFMNSTDEAHKPMREMMASSPSEEEQKKWWDWFNSEWDKKEEVWTPDPEPHRPDADSSNSRFGMEER